MHVGCWRAVDAVGNIGETAMAGSRLLVGDATGYGRSVIPVDVTSVCQCQESGFGAAASHEFCSDAFPGAATPGERDALVSR